MSVSLVSLYSLCPLRRKKKVCITIIFIDIFLIQKSDQVLEARFQTIVFLEFLSKAFWFPFFLHFLGAFRMIHKETLNVCIQFKHAGGDLKKRQGVADDFI